MSEAKRPEKKEGEAKRPEHVYDPVNERVVIGAALAMLRGGDVPALRAHVRSVAHDELLAPGHAPIWRALRYFVDRALEWDPLVFRRIVLDEGGKDLEGYIDGLEAEAAIPSNLGWYVETMRWDATRARVLNGPLPELLREIRSPKASPDAVAGTARAVARALEGGGGRNHLRRPDELKRQYHAEMDARVASGNFWAMGFGAIDARFSEGTMPGKTCLIAGLSGAGKSTFARNMVIRMARMDRKIVYGAWEEGSVSVLDSMIASMTRIEIARIVQGTLSNDERRRVRRVTEWICDRVKFMDNAFFDPELRGGRGRGRPSNERVMDRLEGYIAQSGCDAWVYDLWERMLVDISYDGVTSALVRQQAMHETYNVWGCLLQQIKGKEVESRSDKRPTRDSIKGAGAYVEVPDLVFGVHRDAHFKDVADDSIEVMCWKQRKGATNWTVRLDWDGTTGHIAGDGVEVSFDTSLEAQLGDGGDIDAIATKPKRGRKK